MPIYLSKASSGGLTGCGCCPESINYTLTLGGITACICLSNGGGVAPSVKWDGTSPNGSSTLILSVGGPNPQWDVNIDNPVFDAYSLPGCSGAITASPTANRRAVMVCQDGVLSLRVIQDDETLYTGKRSYWFLNNNIRIGEAFDNELSTCDTVMPPGTDFISPIGGIVTGTGGVCLIEPI